MNKYSILYLFKVYISFEIVSADLSNAYAIVQFQVHGPWNDSVKDRKEFLLVRQ